MKRTINGYTIEAKANLSDANLNGADLSDADLRNANLDSADLSDADLRNANLDSADLSDADLRNADLRNANLNGADLDGAKLSGADLRNANLAGANLSGANLSGANLSGAYLSDAEGLGTKEGEMSFASLLLTKIRQNPDILEMNSWHCGTTHCIAGHAFPELEYPGQPASLLYPTLAQYFFASNEEAISALERVSRGEESVFS